jgi:hypothetical protein
MIKSKKASLLLSAAMTLGMAWSNAHALSSIGDRTCGQWATRKQMPYNELSAEAWLMGFMTGPAVGTSKDVLADTDGDSVNLWMDNYCRAHPLDRVGTGATTLYFELLARKK